MRFLAFVLLCAVAAPALAQAPETLFNLVTLNAQAERDVANDLLSAVLVAEAEGPEPTALAGTVNGAMQKALATTQAYRAVRARSGNYQTFPVYDKNRITRWRARQELRLESAEFAAATELIGKLQAGGLLVSGMSVSVAPETRRQAENALIAEAIAAFEERARLVREAMKAKGHRVKDLQVSGSGPIARPMVAMARERMLSESAPPAVEPGTTRIVITVSGTIQLQ
jgi:predicted secreted protein